MPRFARLLATALTLAALPGSAPAQSGTPAPAEPALERRTMPPTGSPTARAEPDPWLLAYVGLGGRTARVNLSQLDRALEPYGSSYSCLTPDDRSRLRQSFDDLIPGQQFSRYPITAPQSRAMAYLALGPWERRSPETGCEGPRRRGGHSRCDEAIDSMSRNAAWIHSTILAIGRTGNRRPRDEELGALRAMNEQARGMVMGASGCGCPAAREESETLLAGTRDALDAYERSSMPAWMSLGDQRVQRIARLSDSLERTFIGCMSGG